jgi:hypothetical protein
VKVENIADLSRIRHALARVYHDDERLLGAIVTVLRSGATVMLIICSTDALAFDALRICCGIRFRRENAAAWAASELAALDEPMALAA